jgi:hypothetical protein
MDIDIRELSTVLAALRYWQASGCRPAMSDDERRRACAIQTIATNGETLVPLDAEEIDVLCERLNRA